MRLSLVPRVARASSTTSSLTTWKRGNERKKRTLFSCYIRDSMSQHATDTNDMMMSSGDFSASNAVRCESCAGKYSTASVIADGGGPKDTKAGENLHAVGGAALTSSFRQTSLLPFSAHTVQYVGGAICFYSVRLRHRNKPSFAGYLPQGNQAKTVLLLWSRTSST